MIKVRLSETGQVLKRYPANIEIPQPFIEITEAEANALHELPEGQVWFYKDDKFVVGDDPAYLEKKTKETFKSEMLAIFETDVPQKGVRCLYQPVIQAAITAFEQGNLSEVDEIISSSATLGIPELETAKTNLLSKLAEYTEFE